MSNPHNTLGRIKGGAKRLADVAAILAKYGLAAWLNDSNEGWFARRLRAPDGELLNSRSTEERVRLALTELGTTGIKLGQMLSTRPDLLPPHVIRALEKLQDQVGAFAFDQVERVLAEHIIPPAFEDRQVTDAGSQCLHFVRAGKQAGGDFNFARTDLEEQFEQGESR